MIKIVNIKHVLCQNIELFRLIVTAVQSIPAAN